MPDSFAEWLNDALATTPDPATGLPFEPIRFAKLMGFSVEKLRTWQRGTRVPTTLEDIRLLARRLNRPEWEVLEARGFDVGRNQLTDPQKRVLAALELAHGQPEVEAKAVQVLRALLGPTTDSVATPPQRRRRRVSE